MRSVVLALLAACSFQHGGASGTGGGSDAGRDAPLAKDAPAPMKDAPRDAPPDAPPNDLCAANMADCFAAGGGCVSGTCVITVFANGNITCPDNMPCEIVCAGQGTCSGKIISCGNATSCTVDCAASNTCNGNQFICDHVGCTINCLVDDICDGFTLSDNGSSCTLACCGGGNECSGDSANPHSCADGNSTCP